jgi:hypothetical protein
MIGSSTVFAPQNLHQFFVVKIFCVINAMKKVYNNFRDG